MKRFSGTTRRKFLQQSAGFLGSSCFASSIATGLLHAPSVLASSNDYKALVFIFLAGGNDAFNMIVPRGTGNLRQRYETARRHIAIATTDLHELQLAQAASIYGGGTYDQFGMHPQCPDMASMFNNGEMAAICNIGNLIEPTTRQSYLSNTVNLPPQLFSHSDQQRQFQSSPTNPFRFGWGGRMAELLQSLNTDSSVSSMISVAGLNPFQVGQNNTVNPFVMQADGVTNLSGFAGERQSLVEAMMSANSNHLMEKKYRAIFSSAQQASTIINAAFTTAEANGVDYDAIFEQHGATQTKLGKQLKTIAKLIAGRGSSQNTRPIYYVKMGGFDTHQNILPDHRSLMEQLNGGLKAFRDVLVAQGDFDCTLSYIGSEFGRTLTPNGNNDGAGTDHAWGGHALAMGGMIEGARFYGTHPDLRLGQGLDADNQRGRWIPTTSVAESGAVIARWLGIPENDLTQIFPTLANFPDPLGVASDLKFINAGAMA